ncbi:MAG: NADH-quinone oxidoreductase subunit J [Thermodesulfovibrionales bacterium]|nr:NADH-quinone oxidoreductase subunit J [Thermodesulfovibrionales bacterium]
MIQIFFAYLAIAIIGLSIFIITRKNPVHSVLGMLFMFIHVGALYLFLNAEFLAAVQVIVYAGAILVLFLFAIMILNIKEELKTELFIGSWVMAIPVTAGLAIMLLLGLRTIKPGYTGSHSIEYIKTMTHTKAFGKELFMNYLLPFELVSIILLVAIVGAIVLSKKRL